VHWRYKTQGVNGGPARLTFRTDGRTHSPIHAGRAPLNRVYMVGMGDVVLGYVEAVWRVVLNAHLVVQPRASPVQVGMHEILANRVQVSFCICQIGPGAS
jgi:hypothetical protein